MTTESAYLIEDGESQVCAPKYLVFQQLVTMFREDWTSDHMQATRFVTKDEADRVEQLLVKAHPDKSYRVCEHQWG